MAASSINVSHLEAYEQIVRQLSKFYLVEYPSSEKFKHVCDNFQEYVGYVSRLPIEQYIDLFSTVVKSRSIEGLIREDSPIEVDFTRDQDIVNNIDDVRSVEWFPIIPFLKILPCYLQLYTPDHTHILIQSSPHFIIVLKCRESVDEDRNATALIIDIATIRKVVVNKLLDAVMHGLVHSQVDQSRQTNVVSAPKDRTLVILGAIGVSALFLGSIAMLLRR